MSTDTRADSVHTQPHDICSHPFVPWGAVGAGTPAASATGFAAVRSARWADRHRVILQGPAVWELSFLVTAVALGGGVMAMLHGVSLSDAVNGLADAGERMSGAPGDVGRGMSESETESLKEAATPRAWWVVATMVLGFAGAVAGGARKTRVRTHADRLRSNRWDDRLVRSNSIPISGGLV